MPRNLSLGRFSGDGKVCICFSHVLLLFALFIPAEANTPSLNNGSQISVYPCWTAGVNSGGDPCHTITVHRKFGFSCLNKTCCAGVL
jgi:hypothetical protein